MNGCYYGPSWWMKDIVLESSMGLWKSWVEFYQVGTLNGTRRNQKLIRTPFHITWESDNSSSREFFWGWAMITRLTDWLWKVNARPNRKMKRRLRIEETSRMQTYEGRRSDATTVPMLLNLLEDNQYWIAPKLPAPTPQKLNEKGFLLTLWNPSLGFG